MISRDYLSQIENGREPSPRLVQQIELLERVGITADYADSVDRSAGQSLAEDSSQELEAEIRRFIDEVLRGAQGDAGRLGWIREQLHAHLRTPAHWSASKAAILKKALTEQRPVRSPEKGQESTG